MNGLAAPNAATPASIFEDVEATPVWLALRAVLIKAEQVFAGIAARAYVQGAMDPAYATPAARDARAQELLKIGERVTASFLRGWVEHRDTDLADPGQAVWFRLIGDTCIEVTRA